MRKHLLFLATAMIVASASPLFGQGARPATPVEVINTPTVDISPAENTVKLDASSVVDPALTPYFHVDSTLDCPFLNVCSAQGPAVPTGKRLRVTNITGFFPDLLAGTYFVYFQDPAPTIPGERPLVAFPETVQNLGFFGLTLSFNHEINFYLEAGQQPEVRVGSTVNIRTSSAKVTISGYLVDVVTP